MTGDRDLSKCIDQFGNIYVHVNIGGNNGAAEHSTGASASPATVAKFLRNLAADVERLTASGGAS